MRNQRGSATLIVILIILLLVTLLSTWAIKSSTLGLRIATNSQAQTLLMENSDAVLYYLEQSDVVKEQLKIGGIFSYFNSSRTANDQVAVCYNATTVNNVKPKDAINITHARITRKGQSSALQDGLACGVSNNRGNIQSRMYITKMPNDDDNPFAKFAVGTSIGETGVPMTSVAVNVTVVSALPAFSDATSDTVKGCFNKELEKDETVNGHTVTVNQVAKCFEDAGVPYNMQRADYAINVAPTLQ